mgnify:FL=1
MKELNFEEIKNRMNEIMWDEGWGVVALRAQAEPFELGDLDHNSVIWIDGEETEEELNGVCGLALDDVELINNYYNDHIAIIAGDRYEWGQDAGEIIIEDAQVVKIIR